MLHTSNRAPFTSFVSSTQSNTANITKWPYSSLHIFTTFPLKLLIIVFLSYKRILRMWEKKNVRLNFCKWIKILIFRTKNWWQQYYDFFFSDICIWNGAHNHTKVYLKMQSIAKRPWTILDKDSNTSVWLTGRNETNTKN